MLCLCLSCTVFNCYHGSCIYCIYLSKIKKHSKNYFSINTMQWIWFIFLKCNIWTGDWKKKKVLPTQYSNCFHRKMHVLKVSLLFWLTNCGWETKALWAATQKHKKSYYSTLMYGILVYIHKKIPHLQHNHWDLAFTVFTSCLPVFTGLLYMVWQILSQYFFFAISTRTREFFKLTISFQMHLKDLKY